MPSRRALLATLAATTVAPLLAGPAGAFAPKGVPGGIAAGLLGPRPEIRPWGKFFIVNGWVLTASDLETLGLA
jgi:hypothetical protein